VKATIFAVFNQKGGVAKTTTAVNLSASLALLDRRVLLIDFDPQAHSTIGLGIAEPKFGVDSSVYDFIFGDLSFDDILRPTCIKGLDLIPASLDLSGAAIEMAQLPQREYYLKNALSKIQRFYDYIIIDSPPSLCLLSINVLSVANQLIIPMQCEYYPLEGLSKMLSTVEQIQKNHNPLIEVSGVLLTMCDFRNLLSRQVEADVRGYLGEVVYKTTIPRNIKLSEAPSFGLPVVLHDKRCTGSLAYSALAQEIDAKHFPQ
jgi:chromosome partitioning protein